MKNINTKEELIRELREEDNVMREILEMYLHHVIVNSSKRLKQDEKIIIYYDCDEGIFIIDEFLNLESFKNDNLIYIIEIEEDFWNTHYDDCITYDYISSCADEIIARMEKEIEREKEEEHNLNKNN